MYPNSTCVMRNLIYDRIINNNRCLSALARMSADPVSRPNTAPSSVERSPYHSHPHHPYHGRDRADMMLQDVHSSGE